MKNEDVGEADGDLRPEYDLSNLKDGVRGKYARRLAKRKLPLPVWCFVLLGIPTFYMPLAYVTLAVWVLGRVLIGSGDDLPQWLHGAIWGLLYVTAVMWPLYVVWVAVTKRLTLREKGFWLFIVSFLNMLGMPWFYVFMIRRYLGIEGRISPRDEAALDSFLARCGTDRSDLSDSQITVLRSYCRDRRMTKWLTIVAIPFAALVAYLALVVLPGLVVPMSVDMTPTRVIIIDSAKDTRREIVPDPDSQRLHVQVILLFGTYMGVITAGGLCVLSELVHQSFRETGGRKVLMDFLKAGKKGRH